MEKYGIDATYGVPVEEISCPGCGLRYGHHNTKVDTISQECSVCVKIQQYKYVELVTATDFIENTLGYSKHT